MSQAVIQPGLSQTAGPEGGRPRVVVFGGASALWTPVNVARMAASRSMSQSDIVLYDLHYERAQRMAELCEAMLKRHLDGPGPTVTAAETLPEALRGAYAVISVYCVGGQSSEAKLNGIAESFGSKQICYTAGPAAMLYIALQSPPMIELVRAMREHAPDAWLINCANPLPGLCMVASQAGMPTDQLLGFCGAMPWYRRGLASFLDIEPERLDFRLAGTNHCTFFTDVRIDGQDASAEVRRKVEEKGEVDQGVWGTTTLPIELYRRVGYFPSGDHVSDIYPSCRGTNKPAEGQTSKPPLPPEWTPEFLDLLDAYGRGEEVGWAPPSAPEPPVSWFDELAGLGTGRTQSINLTNGHAVANMPPWSVIDLECVMDRRGVTPLATPDWPDSIAETARRHQVSFRLAADAAVRRDTATLVEALRQCPFQDLGTVAPQIVEKARQAFGDLFPL